MTSTLKKVNSVFLEVICSAEMCCVTYRVVPLCCVVVCL